MARRDQPLLHDQDHDDFGQRPPVTPITARRIFVNFIIMSIFFAINHGTVTALIALASSAEGKWGNYSTGILYVLYTLVALFFSNVIVEQTGYKWGLVAGLLVYCAYVVSFLIFNYTHSAPAALIGSGIGGIAAGFLWTAQGGYFSLTCSLYAEATQQPKEHVTASLGGWFAAFYLGGEVTLKLLSSALAKISIGGAHSGGLTLVFITFSIAAVASTLGMTLIEDLQKYEKPDPAKEASKKRPLTQRVSAKTLAALGLLVTDPKMALLIPAQLAFGFMSGYINATANKDIVKTYLHKSNIGYVVAITPATATLLSFPIGFLTKRISKVYLMVLGGALFCIEALLFMNFSDEHLGTWTWCAILYAIHGAGRCVWESTNKAVMADFFATSAPAAFANVIWSSGGASSIAFFLFPHISKTAQLSIALAAGALQIITSIFAFAIHRKEQAAKNAGARSMDM